MSTRLTCFFIAPIGEPGSEIRKNSDYLLELIIRPALEKYNIDVIRGDHRNETGKIDQDIIKLIQESEFCVADMSLPNANVYYELGRRDETGKPVILLKSMNSDKLPADISNRRHISFNLNDLETIITAKKDIQEQVGTSLRVGVKKMQGASLFTINEKIDRIERNIARLMESRIDGGTSSLDGEEDALTMWKVAMLQRNIPKAESAMTMLQYSMDEIQFYDFIVEQTAALGSRKAGKMLIDFINNFMDSVNDIIKKVEYIGCLVTYLNKTNQESQYIDMVEETALKIENEDGQTPSDIFNQLSRLHHGIYVLSGEDAHMNSAITYLEKAIETNPEQPSYYYNLAMCYDSKLDSLTNEEEKQQTLQLACEYVRRAIELAGDNYDTDHLILACRLFYQSNNAEWIDFLELLNSISPDKAMLLKRELK